MRLTVCGKLINGGKNAKTIREKQRKMVTQALNLHAVYIQNVFNDDPGVFAASGFTVKSAPPPVGALAFGSLDYCVNSGQIVVSVKAQSGAKVVLHPLRGNGWRKGIRPIPRQSRTLAGFLFLRLPVPSGAKTSNPEEN